MIRSSTFAAAVLFLSGCGVTAGGVRGEVAFRATAVRSEYASVRSPQVLAACFARNARMLPFSLIADDPVDKTPVYRLRYKDFWFEQIAFRQAPGGGTRVEVITSGNYDGKWTALLVRDRLDPLGRCLAFDPDATAMVVGNRP